MVAAGGMQQPLEVVDDIVEFVKGYINQDPEIIRDMVIDHINYNTIDVAYHRDKLVGVVRYNIDPPGHTAHILDLVIKNTDRGKRIIKYFIARGWSRFPSLRYIKFCRGLRGDDRERIYSIRKLLRGV